MSGSLEINRASNPNDVVSLALVAILGARKPDQYRALSFGDELSRFVDAGIPFTLKKNDGLIARKSPGPITKMLTESTAWTDAGGSVFKKYLQSEVSRMWVAFHGGELPIFPLDDSLNHARLSRGSVNGKGYDLVQFGPRVPVIYGSNILDVAIRPNGLDELPMVPPELRQRQTFFRSEAYEDVVTDRLIVVGKEEILSPLIWCSANIVQNERKRLEGLFDSMAEGMLGMREAVRIKGVCGIGFNEARSLKIRSEVRSTEIVRSPIQNGDYGNRMRYILRKESRTRQGEQFVFINNYRTDRPFDLLDMMSESEVNPDTIVRIVTSSGKEQDKTMKQLVFDKLKEMDKLVAKYVEKVTTASLVCAEGVTHDLDRIKGTPEQRINRRNLATVLFSTWPVALLKYYQNYYRHLFLEFTTTGLKMEHPPEYYAQMMTTRKINNDY